VIVTKRHPLKFYASLVFGFLFLFALGTMLMLISIKTLQKENIENKEYFLPVISFLLYSSAFLIVYTYWKSSPQVVINQDIVKIGNQSFNLRDIKDIILTGKMPFRFIITLPMEGTALLFNDGTQKILFDDMYSNSSEVKLFLEQVVLNKQEYKPIVSKNIDKDVIRFADKEIFKGNQLTSLRGISLWGVIGFFGFIFLLKDQPAKIGPMIFILLFLIFWFVLNSWLMHYFELTKDYLVVRNHNFIWKIKIYQLSDIKEIVFETQGKQPNCMRVITKDFKNKIYPAGTLRDKTWLLFKDKLEAKGITVRNECI